MFNCILCLTGTSELEAIDVNEQQLEAASLADAIQQHFLFADLIFSRNQNPHVCCQPCCRELQNFHTFFDRIKAKHQIFDDIIETENKEFFVKCEVLDTSSGTVSDHHTDVNSLIIKRIQNSEDDVELTEDPIEDFNEGTQQLRVAKATKPVEILNRKPGRPRKLPLPKPTFNSDELLLPKKFYRRRTELDDRKIAESIDMKCDRCEERLESFSQALSHHRDVHDQKGYLMCCSRKFKQRSALVDHLDFHSNPDHFQCKVCKKNFTSLSNLRTHITVAHLPQTRFACDRCGKSLNCKYRLAAHMKTHIVMDPPATSFECIEQDCGKMFQTKSGLQSHVKVCHNPNRETFWCEVCGKELMTRHSLKDHIKNTHTAGTSKIQCSLCGHYIKNEYSMKKHLNRHKQMEQNITCGYCEKKCTTKAALRSHVRMKHLLERNLKCRFCDKKFKQNIDREEHEATHTGVDLYSCLWCPATFKFGANFRAHRKNVHPEEYEKIKPAWLRPN